MIPCKYHGWVFTMSLQLSLHGIITVYKMFNNISNVGVHECYNAVIIIPCTMLIAILQYNYLSSIRWHGT